MFSSQHPVFFFFLYKTDMCLRGIFSCCQLTLHLRDVLSENNLNCTFPEAVKCLNWEL